MVNASDITEHMDVVGADGVHVGKVDHLDGDRIKLVRKDPDHGQDDAHHHYLQLAAVASVDGGKLWLSADAANAQQLLEEEDGSPVQPGERNSKH